MYLDVVIPQRTTKARELWVALLGLGILIALWARAILKIPLENGLLDWYSINLQLDVVRQAIVTNDIPGKLLSLGTFDYGGYYGEEFWTFPYLIRTPDLILLTILSNKFYILIHLLIFISIGYVGFFKLFKKFIPSSAVCATAGITYFYSGMFIGRIAAGHLQLLGYFLVPMFILIVLNVLEDNRRNQRSGNWMKASLLLSLVAYLGSIQTLFQMFLFLFVLVVFKKSRLFAIKSFLSTLLMISPIIFASSFSSSYRIRGATRSVFEGFGWRFLNQDFFKDSYADLEQSFSIPSLLAFLPKQIVEVILHFIAGSTNWKIAIERGGWEWDIYVLPLGFIALLVPLISKAARFKLVQFSAPTFRPLVAVLIVFLLLSLSFVYRIIFSLLQSVVNINAIDRLPVRSIIYPLTFVFLICFILLNHLIQSRRQGIRIFGYALIFANLVLVILHSEFWLRATEMPFSQMIIQNSAFIGQAAPFEFAASSNKFYQLLISGMFVSTIWILYLILQLFKLELVRIPMLNRRC